jgi:hypothetical protein
MIAPDSLESLLVDYNIYDDRLSADGGVTALTLDAWRSQLGQDAHSFVATPDELFLNPSSGLWIHGRNPGINAGATLHAPSTDLFGRDRIAAPDIGALEAGDTDSFSKYGVESLAEFSGVIQADYPWWARLTPAFLDRFEPRVGTPESPLGSDWDLLPWHSDDDGTPDVTSFDGLSLYLRGAVIRSTATYDGAVETDISLDSLNDAVAVGASRVFGIGNDFGARSGNYWAAFVTKGAKNTLYAQLNLNGSLQQVNLGAMTLHDAFRIEPTSTGFRFYRDRQLVASLDGLFPDTVDRRILLGTHHDASAMHVEYVEAGPYTSGGTYTSPVHDERVSGAWGKVEIPQARPLGGTSLLFETRTGQTATPDDSWSAWEFLGADDMIQSPEGRYIQVRVTLVTTNPQRTPLFFGYSIETRPAA